MSKALQPKQVLVSPVPASVEVSGGLNEAG